MGRAPQLAKMRVRYGSTLAVATGLRCPQRPQPYVDNKENGLIDKTLTSCAQAVAQVHNGATVMFGGFGSVGVPGHLVDALRDQGARDLTIISNGASDAALSPLFEAGRVKKLIATFPSPTSHQFRARYLNGEVQLELVPQGTLVERIRAGGSGLGGIYTPTGVGTELAEGKEVRVIDGREYLLELPLKADFAFLKARLGDRFGNLAYRGTMRNFNMAMATAGKVVVAEVEQIVAAGEIPPEQVHTPGIFVDHVVQAERHPRLVELPKPKEGGKKA